MERHTVAHAALACLTIPPLRIGKKRRARAGPGFGSPVWPVPRRRVPRRKARQRGILGEGSCESVFRREHSLLTGGTKEIVGNLFCISVTIGQGNQADLKAKIGSWLKVAREKRSQQSSGSPRKTGKRRLAGTGQPSEPFACVRSWYRGNGQEPRVNLVAKGIPATGHGLAIDKSVEIRPP